MQDIIVYISLDTASKEKETLLPLILSFEGAFAYKEYNKAEDVAKDFTTASSPTLAAAQKLFDQIKVENCPGRTKKVAIFGLASDSTAKATTDALDTLRETHDDWYFLIPAGATDTIITALSTWASATVLTLAQLESGMVESEKLLIAQTKTKSLITTAMKANKQTVICYNHDADNTSIPAAWVGRVAPNYPTSVTWKWKELFGIPVTDEKGTDREDLLEGRYNMYIERHGREYMSEGICTDGDFIDIDHIPACAGIRSGRVAILSHGLEGNSTRRYMLGMAEALNRRGWDVVARNFRGCSGEMNHTLQLYHGGETNDLHLVVQYCISLGYGSIVLVGFSMGGNQTLKYLGERDRAIPSQVSAAVAVSVPCDMEGAAEVLSLPSRAPYMAYFLRTLRRKVEEKHSRFPRNGKILLLRGFLWGDTAHW
mgnify:CR=1 FL=1